MKFVYGVVIAALCLCTYDTYVQLHNVDTRFGEIDARMSAPEEAREGLLSAFHNSYKVEGDGFSFTATPIHTEFVDGVWKTTFLTARHCLVPIPEIPSLKFEEGIIFSVLDAAYGQTIASANTKDFRVHRDLDIGTFVAVSLDEIPVAGVGRGSPAFGERVYMCGFGLGVGPYLTDGVYSVDGCSSAHSIFGFSGSAVFNKYGEIVGVLSGGYGSQFQAYTFMSVIVPLGDFKGWLDDAE